MSLTPEKLVEREVFYCASSLVHTLSQAYGHSVPDQMESLSEQAFELSCPLDDWEGAAIDAGWSKTTSTGEWCRPYRKEEDEPHAWDAITPAGTRMIFEDTVEHACWRDDIEPHQREIFEHWIVSDWLADRLAERGEKVDKDFAGLPVWARTTTGQGIAQDWVISQLCTALNKPVTGV